jgi:hypothetical protein
MAKPPLKRLEALFHQAAAPPPEDRWTSLDGQCAGEPELDVRRYQADTPPIWLDTD